jgi:hypothetical protein
MLTPQARREHATPVDLAAHPAIFYKFPPRTLARSRGDSST